MAQSVEQLIRNQQVGGSSPPISSIIFFIGGVMKKVFKTMAVVLCLLLIIPVFAACNDKQLVLSQVQSSGKEIARGERIYLQTTYGNSVLEDPDIRIVYDSNAQGEAVSASIQNNILTIAEDAEIGAVIRVQAFYNKQNSNTLEFVVVHKDIDKISFNADDIEGVGANEYVTTKLPGEEIYLKDVVQILPEYASYVEDGVEKNYTVADLQVDIIASGDTHSQFEEINAQGSIDVGVRILSTATKGYSFTIHVSINDIHAYLMVTVEEQKPTISWKENAFDVYHGTTISLMDLVDFYPGNEDTSSALSVEFMISSFSETNGDLDEVFVISGSSLTIAHYASQATISKSCYIIAKVVGYEDEMIQTQAVPFTIRSNELVRVDIKEEYKDKNNPISTSNIYNLQEYIALVGEIEGADVTTDINTNTLQILIANDSGVDETYFFTDVNTMRFGIRPFSSLQGTQAISLKFKVGSFESETLNFEVTRLEEMVKLQLDNGIGEVEGEREIYAGTYRVSFVCYAGDKAVPTELCNNITLRLVNESDGSNIQFANNELVIGDDVVNDTTFTMQYVVSGQEPQTIATFTVKNTNEIMLDLREDAEILGGSGMEGNPYLLSPNYTGDGPYITGTLTLNGIEYNLPRDVQNVGVTFEVVYDGNITDFINVNKDQDWGKFNTEPCKNGGSVSVQILVKNVEGTVICSSNTIYLSFSLAYNEMDIQKFMDKGVTEIYIMQGITTSSLAITNNITLIGGSEDAYINGSFICNTDNTNIMFKNLTLQQSIITLSATCSNITVDFENVEIEKTVTIINLNQNFYNEKLAMWENMFMVTKLGENAGTATVNVSLMPKRSN